MDVHSTTTTLFVPTAPLPFNNLQRTSRSRLSKSTPICAARRPAQRATIPRILLTTAGVILSGIRFTPLPIHLLTPPANAASANTTTETTTPKSLRYDGRQELDSREKAMSLTLTAGTFAALGVWAWRRNRKEDELENIRIKDEVERLEKLQAEFLDVEQDDDGMDDEDLFASLKQRISEGEEDDGKTVAGGSDDENNDTGESSSGTGTATLDRDSNTESDADPSGSSATNDVDILKRMWEATDDDKDNNEKK